MAGAVREVSQVFRSFGGRDRPLGSSKEVADFGPMIMGVDEALTMVNS